MRSLLASVLLIGVAVVSGCGPSGPKTYPVSGTVSFENQPIPDGYISFIAADGEGPPGGGPIKDGKFSFEATAGKKRVEVNASREEGPVDPAMGATPRKPYIPARYNTETTLEANVTPEGPNTFDYPLTGK